MSKFYNPHDPFQDLWSIIATIFILALGIRLLWPVAIAFWPIGIIWLFRKLMRGSTSNRKYQSPHKTQSAPRSTYTSKPTQTAPKTAVPSPAPAAPKVPLAGKGFIISGGIVSGLFGFSLLVALSETIASHTWRGDFTSLTTLAGLTGVGLVLLYVGLFRRKRSKLFRKYLAMIGSRESVSISALAKAMGRSYKKVCDELQDMLDFGVLPMGYLDLANDKLVLTSQGIADEPAPQPQPEPKQDENAILAEIRAVNDAIPDPTMSVKIDRIGQLTGKILDYQRQHPDKEGQLRSFLNYYLPTTLKILRAYAQLDQQGVEGENISAAKARIEGMMDKVVEGFEKQLDKLFRDEALDITSDVSVLEKMLDKDGLGQNGMTLGG